jgi:hypothetical protein
MFDRNSNLDLKAEERFSKAISLPIPNSESGETAKITIRISLLPKEWRKERRDGGAEFAKKRRIQDNEGISILRADREVLYAKIPYLIGERGQAAYEDIDRWWGCEISFPPELDNYFQVRYIKRGAEPIESLRDKIRTEITRKILDLRAEIQKDFALEAEKKAQEKGIYVSAEEKMQSAHSILPTNKTPPKTENDLDRIADELEKYAGETPNDINKGRTAIKKELQEKHYSIKSVDLPQHVLFEPEYLGERILIKLNVKHPFYLKVLKPLCGAAEDLEDDTGKLSMRNQQFWDAILLLLMSYCKAEALYPGETLFLEHLRTQWGMALAAVYSKVD